MIFKSSVHSDYQIEVEDGKIDLSLLNKVVDSSLPKSIKAEELSSVLKQIQTKEIHPYIDWLRIYGLAASKKKKDGVLPDTAYWNHVTYQEIKPQSSLNKGWEWTKITRDGLSEIGDFVAMDVETTGLTNDDSIIQLSAVKFVNGQIADTYDTFLKPSNDKPVSRVITDITGITQEDVEHAPSFIEVYRDFLDFCGDLIWVGHNISFDIRMFENEMKRANLDMPDLVSADTLTITKEVYPFWSSRGGAYKLENIKHRLKPGLIDGLTSHNSLADSKMCGWWLLQMMEDLHVR